MKHFNYSGINPLLLAELSELLSLEPNDIDNPRRFNQLKDIAEHYSDSPTLRRDVLRVLNGKSGDRMDLLWTYVELEKAKKVQLAKLDPVDFDPDVAEEIVSGHVTTEKVDRVKADIAERKAALLSLKDTKPDATSQLEKIEQTLQTFEDLAIINRSLQAY